MIFEGKGSPSEQLSYKIVGFYLEYVDNKVRKRIRNPSFPIIHANGVIGFFDGASQMGSYGYGLYIKFSTSHVIYGWFGGGEGSNTRAKLLAYWGLLSMIAMKEIYTFHVCGYSKYVLNWVQGNTSLQVSDCGY